MVHAQDTASVMRTASTPGQAVKDGVTRRIVRTRDLMAAIIDFSGGPWAEPDPFHSHPHEQITFVASGDIVFLAEGSKPQRLGAGDVFAVPSQVCHSIQLLSAEARLVDTFTPIREEFF
jgi:quercetin dioxygenase-like cupin family protein